MHSVDKAQRYGARGVSVRQRAATTRGVVDLVVRRAGARSACRSEGSLTIGRGPADVGRARSSTIGSSRASTCGSRAPRADTRSRTSGARTGPSWTGRGSSGRRVSPSGALVLFGNQVAVFRLVADAELAALQQDAATPFGPVPTSSPALALIYARLRKLARTDAELLLVGETGVGKEVCARAIHRASGRKGRFVAINCTALPASLVESELFGYLAGAHSTARTAKPGLVEAADGGTLLLDEIGDMAPELQTKIFRFLQDRTFSPLGSTKLRRVDVRVIAATTRQAIGVGRGALRARPGRAAGGRADRHSAAAQTPGGDPLPGGALCARGPCARSSRPRSERCASTAGPSTSASWRRPSPTPSR